jgi:hypothetical protein
VAAEADAVEAAEVVALRGEPARSEEIARVDLQFLNNNFQLNYRNE